MSRIRNTVGSALMGSLACSAGLGAQEAGRVAEQLEAYVEHGMQVPLSVFFSPCDSSNPATGALFDAASSGSWPAERLVGVVAFVSSLGGTELCRDPRHDAFLRQALSRGARGEPQWRMGIPWAHMSLRDRMTPENRALFFELATDESVEDQLRSDAAVALARRDAPGERIAVYMQLLELDRLPGWFGAMEGAMLAEQHPGQLADALRGRLAALTDHRGTVQLLRSIEGVLHDEGAAVGTGRAELLEVVRRTLPAMRGPAGSVAGRIVKRAGGALRPGG